MIHYLNGKLFETDDGASTVNIEFPGGGAIGYRVAHPNSARYSGWLIGQTISFYIHSHVREDAFDLYGFLSSFERELFLTLLSVNGIGPKGGLSILTQIDPETLVQLVMTGDKDSLTKVPGVGKKTAERLVLELTDTIQKKVKAGKLPQEWLFAATGGSGSGKTKSVSTPTLAGAHVAFLEAKDALVSLGYREAQVTDLLKRFRDSEEELKDAPSSAWIKRALKELR
ncbi:MAG: Holliday junction branch migration protein RuvA [Proteobacteria bacterium]|nr:MAG: Holliday junction branch migration protein RuvA [Pseudomonadota bacterium]